jgi:AraC-like DNA-binding protein
MADFGPLVTSGVLAGIDAFLASRGVDYGDVLRSAGLTYDEVDPSDHKEIPLEQVIAIFNACSNMTKAPCFGAEWAEAFPVRSAGAYGYLLMNAATVEEALRLTVRYLSLVIHPVAIDLEFDSREATLSWRFSPNLQVRATQYILFAAGATISRLRAVADGNWNPHHVEFPFPEIPCRTVLNRVMGAPIVFDGPMTRIVMDVATLSRKNHHADPQLFELIKDLGDRLLRERSTETPLAQMVRRAIMTRLGMSEVSLDAIAAGLDLTPRALQSRLAAHETSFEAILQITKQELAEGYLRDTDLTLTEIALLLGFSELSAFTRASLRWFKKPPSALRQQLRQGERSALQ